MNEDAEARAVAFYERHATTREACQSVIEIRPADVRYLPERLLDGTLAEMALRLGAGRDDLPPSLS